MNLLQTAKATERTAAAKRTLDVDDLPVGVVHDGHVKRTGRTAVLTQAAVGICIQIQWNLSIKDTLNK